MSLLLGGPAQVPQLRFLVGKELDPGTMLKNSDSRHRWLWQHFRYVRIPQQE